MRRKNRDVRVAIIGTNLQHGVVLNLGLSQRRAVLRNEDQLGCQGADR